MFWPDTISKKFGIAYPIIQAPMFGVSTTQMVAAASRAGALGSLALADLSADESVKLIRETKKLTDKPFAVNIFAHDIPVITEDLKQKFIATKIFLEKLGRENNIEVSLPELEDIKVNGYHEQIDVLIEEGCNILSFTFGNLDDKSIQKLKENGVILMGTCTSVKEALILENSGIDVICVQGTEAGGHRGTFDPDHVLQIGGLSLLAQVYDHVKLPLVYAGGIYNAKILHAVKNLGAKGFQVGNLLLASRESALEPFEKARLKKVREEEVVLTKSFSGRYARGVKNTFIETVENSEYILPYPYQNKLTNGLRKAAKLQQNADFVGLWTGQSIHDYSELSTEEILRNLIVQTEAD
ncbi:nitronate monooxygenase [Chryseobacterium indologenes]|uniref:NAD(P)H-dependent flavin oxidoreductase n=1 Tax=Chryseobacterium indologenes TaxID=253 RepID=UPI0003E081FA|nr:nitronate monooxygenase [Chryseobacterium indologenes]TLX26231.1 nitronate monooxygenase [Chryseobacterium indologenes]GAE66520.1 putative 2-nitropropane dioxygenase [Chryseobacterium indologenes NBRC 14944]SFK47609.1 nitronate monooxygenase [Chryseobacterium indologenes]SUX53034.1 Nitronate monooxygenase [Chryseobacterium indologenes]